MMARDAGEGGIVTAIGKIKTPYRYYGAASDVYRSVRRVYRRITYSGSGVRCLVCDKEFKAWLRRSNTGRCPSCNSSTRHKIAAIYLSNLQRKGELKGKKFLFFAPDPGLQHLLRSWDVDVLTTDLSAPHVDLHADITALPMPDNSYDVILISHVLEHIPEDRAAMRELFRVLAPGGIALVQVPISDAPFTDEDPSVTDPKIRKLRWGLEDHVRLYGRDLVDRLEKAGFQVEEMRLAQDMSDEELKRYGLWNDLLFVCHKLPATGQDS